MKTIIETKKGSSREEVIKESLQNGLKPQRVSNDRAILLVRQGSHVYCPKSLVKDGADTQTHYINTEFLGNNLVSI